MAMDIIYQFNKLKHPKLKEGMILWDMKNGFEY